MYSSLTEIAIINKYKPIYYTLFTLLIIGIIFMLVGAINIPTEYPEQQNDINNGISYEEQQKNLGIYQRTTVYFRLALAGSIIMICLIFPCCIYNKMENDEITIIRQNEALAIKRKLEEKKILEKKELEKKELEKKILEKKILEKKVLEEAKVLAQKKRLEQKKELEEKLYESTNLILNPTIPIESYESVNIPKNNIDVLDNNYITIMTPTVKFKPSTYNYYEKQAKVYPQSILKT